MAEVKLKEETELWGPPNTKHRTRTRPGLWVDYSFWKCSGRPEPPHIKEEPEEEQLQEFPPVSVKSEDDEDKSSVLHQRLTEENREETNGEDCGVDSDSSWDWDPPAKPSLKQKETEECPAVSRKKPKRGVQTVSSKCHKELPLHIVSVKLEGDQDESSVLHQRPTEENREETNGKDCGAEAGCSSDPLTHLHSDSEHTDHSDDWTQEQTPVKRSFAMINPESSVSDGGDDGKPHRCSECGKRFQRKTTLKNHMLLHTGQKPFKCSVCEKAFRDKGNLKVHMRTHTGEKPFSCPDCNLKFTHKLSLDRHMSVHSEEKTFSCPFCKKAFTRLSTFRTHLRFHTGETPYICSFCNKGFTLKSHLSAHIRSHTGEKPFSCSVCKKLFSHKGNLKAHMAIHKEETV